MWYYTDDIKTDEQLRAEAKARAWVGAEGGIPKSRWDFMTPGTHSDVGVHIEYQMWQKIGPMPHLRVRGTMRRAMEFIS